MTKSNIPRECSLDTLTLLQRQMQADTEKQMSLIFVAIDKKPYKSFEDKKMIECIGQMIEYIESVKYTQDKMIMDLRFAWDSYYESEKNSSHQYESFKNWYTKNYKLNGN